MQRKSITRSVVMAIAGLLILAGLLLLAGSLLPYERLKPIADEFARDGSLERFTPALLVLFKPGLLIVALICIAAGGLVFVARERLSDRLGVLLQASPRKALKRDLKELAAALRAEMRHRRELGMLAIITLLAIVIRGLALSQPMLHDEAYTFIAFASKPFANAISNYSLPNNHVFHTVLVYLAYHLLGNQPWIIRLPAFVAGVAIIPLAYGAGSIYYSRKAGLLSAGLAAASPLLISYSANARGYTLVCAFTLCAVILAAYIKDHPNSFTWALFVLACALGFYTIPIMLYPFGMVVAWLILSHLVGDTSDAYTKPALGEPGNNGKSNKGAFWKYLVVACLLVAGLTALLYLPIFLNSGIEAVVNNSYVRPDDSAISPIFGEVLLEQIRSRVASTAEQWTAGIPRGAGMLSVVGFIASLALHKRISRHKAPVQVAAVLWILVAIALQKVAPLARVWMFLLPLYIIWSVAGILGLLQLAIPARFQPQAGWVALLAAVLIPGVMLVSTLAQTAALGNDPGAEEGITLYLQDHIQPGDIVVTQSPIATPLQYYFQQYRLPPGCFDYQAADPQKLWVVVSRRYDQTVESVLRRRGLDAYIPDTTGTPAYQYKHLALYELRP